MEELCPTAPTVLWGYHMKKRPLFSRCLFCSLPKNKESFTDISIQHLPYASIGNCILANYTDLNFQTPVRTLDCHYMPCTFFGTLRATKK